MMDLTIDLAEAQSDNDCDEPAPTKGQFKKARSYSSQTTTSDEGDDFQLSSSSSFLQFSKTVSLRLIENHAHGTRYSDIQWPLPSDSDNVLWIRLLIRSDSDQIRL